MAISIQDPFAPRGTAGLSLIGTPQLVPLPARRMAGATFAGLGIAGPLRPYSS